MEQRCGHPCCVGHECGELRYEGADARAIRADAWALYSVCDVVTMPDALRAVLIDPGPSGDDGHCTNGRVVLDERSGRRDYTSGIRFNAAMASRRSPGQTHSRYAGGMV